MPKLPPGRREGIIMSNGEASSPTHATAADNETGNPREHSEAAAEGTDGPELPEIRMHSQEAAEGPDDD